MKKRNYSGRLLFTLIICLSILSGCGTTHKPKPIFTHFSSPEQLVKQRDHHAKIFGDAPCLEEYEDSYQKNLNEVLIYKADWYSHRFECLSFTGKNVNAAIKKANDTCNKWNIDCALIAKNNQLEPWVNNRFWHALDTDIAPNKGFSLYNDWKSSIPYKKFDAMKTAIYKINRNNTNSYSTNLDNLVQSHKRDLGAGALIFSKKIKKDLSSLNVFTKGVSAEGLLNECKNTRGATCILIAINNFFTGEYMRLRYRDYYFDIQNAKFDNSPEGKLFYAEQAKRNAKKAAKREERIREKRARKERQDAEILQGLGIISDSLNNSSSSQVSSGSTNSYNNTKEADETKKSVNVPNKKHCITIDSSKENTIGDVAFFKNSCGENLNLTYCFGLGSSCKSTKSATDVPAYGKRSFFYDKDKYTYSSFLGFACKESVERQDCWKATTEYFKYKL